MLSHQPTPELSIVVPFYNEEHCLIPVCSEIIKVLTKEMDCPWELVLVDDGSTDRTPDLMDSLCSSNPPVKAVHINPNSGQSAALEAGFSIARGTFIAVLDGDGQNDPRDIPMLMNALNQRNVHLMCGIRTNRADTRLRKLSSKIANRVRNAILKDNITDVGCAIRVFRRQCLEHIQFFRNAHRFFPALMIRAGYTVSEMPVNHRPRIKGTSKYGMGIQSRLWTGIVDLAGVYWLTKRTLSYTIRENHAPLN